MTSYVYAGCYTSSGLRWVGADPGKGITTFAFDGDTGLLKEIHSVTEQDNPAWLEAHPNGKFLLATHEWGPDAEKDDGHVSSYRIDASTGQLTLVDRKRTGGRGNTSVALNNTHQFLLVTQYWEGAVCVLPFNSEEGTIGEVTSTVAHTGKGPHPLRQSAPHPHGFVGDPVTSMVYAADLGCDKVFQYCLDTTTGKLQPATVAEVDMPAGSGPRGMKFHPDSSVRTAFVNCELGGVIVRCSVDAVTGLQPIQTIDTYPPSFVGGGGLGKADRWGSELEITPNGRFIFGINRVDNSICVLSLQSEGDGVLAVQEFVPLSAGNARNLTLKVIGRDTWLLVASQDANLIETFSVNTMTGKLDPISQTASACPTDVAAVYYPEPNDQS